MEMVLSWKKLDLTMEFKCLLKLRLCVLRISNFKQHEWVNLGDTPFIPFCVKVRFREKEEREDRRSTLS